MDAEQAPKEPSLTEQVRNIITPSPEILARFCIPCPDGSIGLDYTTTKTYQTCPLKGKRRYLDHLQLDGTRRAALEFGRAWHKALEVWYRGKNVEAAVKAFSDNYTDIEGEELRTVDRGMRMMRTYAERFPSEDFEVISLEEPIVFDIGHPRIKRISKIDAVMRIGEAYYVFENKHTGAFQNSYFDQFEPNEQIDTEVMAVRAKFGRCDGAYVNVAVVRKGGPRSRKPEFEFFREIISRPAQDLEWTRQNLVAIYNEIESRLARHEVGLPINAVWPGFRDSCHQYRTGCSYRSLCRIGDNDEPANRDEDERMRWYIEKKWNPFTVDAETVSDADQEEG